MWLCAQSGNRTHTALLPGDFKSPMSTYSIIRAKYLEIDTEAWAGIEPAHGGFADRSVTTSPPRQYQSSYTETHFKTSFILFYQVLDDSFLRSQVLCQ